MLIKSSPWVILENYLKKAKWEKFLLFIDTQANGIIQQFSVLFFLCVFKRTSKYLNWINYYTAISKLTVIKLAIVFFQFLIYP